MRPGREVLGKVLDKVVRGTASRDWYFGKTDVFRLGGGRAQCADTSCASGTSLPRTPHFAKRASTSGYILSAASMHACPGRIQFVHRENSRRKQKMQRRSQPLAANGMASLLQGTLK